MDRSAVRHTIEDVERMTPDERRRSFEESIVWDLDDVPAAYKPRIDDIRRRLSDKIARGEQRPAS